MLQAVYPYEGPFPGTLKFSRDEIFLDIREENEYWRLVSKIDGTLGCVPTNFVKRCETKDDGLIQQYARKALISLTASSEKEIQGKDDLVKLLLEIARKKPDENKILCEEFSNLKMSVREKSEPTRDTALTLKAENTTPTLKAIDLPKNFESRLVDTIRLGTNCSYSNCRAVFFAVIDLLSTIPEMKQSFQVYNMSSDTARTEKDYSQSPDWYLLKIKLGYFESRQNNDQECNWSLHDNKHDILERLNELITLLERADPKLVTCYLHFAKFQPVLSLIGLYQRETINQIRSRLLRSIGICCSLDSDCIRICLGSILPIEIVRELRFSSRRDFSHLALRLRFLSILVAQSESLPVDLYASFDQDLFTHLIDLCDTTKEEQSLIDVENQTPDNQILVADEFDQYEQNSQYYMLSYSVAVFLLACNWHFTSVYRLSTPESNLVDSKSPLLKALLAKPIASRLFLETIIQTFNRHLDPTFMITFLPDNKHYDPVNDLTQWASFARFDSNWTDSSKKNLEDFLKNFEANSHSHRNIHNDLEYIQSLWIRNINQSVGSSSKPTLPVHANIITPPDSVVKFLCDLFSFSDTAALIYHNDLDVIIEVINRKMRDEGSNSELLPHLLLLLDLICINSNIVDKGSSKIHDTEELLSSISQTSSLSLRCKTLATASQNQIKSIIGSLSEKS
ncbi:NCK-interacting protein with SH3 domain isoform 2 [Schistosoma japonicum]|uniref:NCK-interacting protein with SH3 domain isoform 2 n=2 Tax=Schistosoma japonicum TaxID=6182 RepID=A0A4Z2DN27_SCHJA|nr:NCK-interacting protein with SH3 domain isoform 2 [Schistosoma japonicum]